MSASLRLTLQSVIPPFAAVLFGFLGLVVLPFFLYGLHVQPDIMILSGAFDPKDRLPYVILPVYYIATLAAAAGPYAAALLTLFTPVMLAFSWRTLGWSRRMAGLAVWATATATLLLLLSPLGRNILIWYFD